MTILGAIMVTAGFILFMGLCFSGDGEFDTGCVLGTILAAIYWLIIGGLHLVGVA